MRRNFKTYLDCELVDEFVKKKDEKAFAEIFDRYFEDVYQFIFSRTLDKTLSEDLCSETFYTLVEVIDCFDKKAKLKSFIIGIALNKIRHSWRDKAKLHETALNEEIFYESEVESFDEEKEDKLKKIIHQVLEKLPENYRNILKKRFLNNKSIGEIALELNLSENNIRVLNHRALKKATQVASEFLQNEK